MHVQKDCKAFEATKKEKKKLNTRNLKMSFFYFPFAIFYTVLLCLQFSPVQKRDNYHPAAKH